MTGNEKLLAIGQSLQRAVVIPAVRELHHLAFEVCLIYHSNGIPNAKEEEGLGIIAPTETIDIAIESLCHISLGAIGQAIDAKAIAIALIAVACHALPSHILTIGRELWVLVITNVEVALLMIDGLIAHALCGVNLRLHIALWLAKVASLASLYII